MEQSPLEKLCKEKLPTKITLELLGLKHLKTVHEYASDMENTRYMVHLPNETIEETKAFLERKEAEWQKGIKHTQIHRCLRYRKHRLLPHYGKTWNETCRCTGRQKKQGIGRTQQGISV